MFGEQVSGRLATAFSGQVSLDSILQSRIHGVLAGHLGSQWTTRVCRVAEAITRDPDVGSGGQRAIEEASGVGRTHLKGSTYEKGGRVYEVQAVLPDESENHLGLLSCQERGLVDYAAEEFEVGVYLVTSDRTGICPSMYPGSSISTSSSGSSSPEKTEITNTTARGGADPRPIAPETAQLLAEGRNALADPARIAILNPRLDIWAPWSAKLAEELRCPLLGDHGWALAVLLGLRDVELPLAEVGKLLGLKKDALRTVVDRLGWVADRHKRGRTVYVRFCWAFVLLGEGNPNGMDEFFTRQTRAMQKSVDAEHTRVRMSPAEKLAWADIWGHRSDESIAAMTDIEREYWLKCRRDRKAEAEHVAMYEKGLENTAEMFRAYFAKEAEKATEKPAERLSVAPAPVERDPEVQARIDALRAKVYAGR